ncbi:MAG: hypothetical protein RR461_02170 [Angelakisella sp.]
MEQQLKQVTMLLEEKKLAFERYEALTDTLMETSDTDIMEDYITKRANMANKIDMLDSRIKQLLCEAFGEEGSRAMKQSTLRESLPQPLQPIYDCNLRILEVVRRIRLKDSDITAGCVRFRDETMEKIKATNNMPKINRYLNNLSSPESVNSFGVV